MAGTGNARCEDLAQQLEDMGFDSGEVQRTIEDPSVTTLNSAIDIILRRQEQQQSNSAPIQQQSNPAPVQQHGAQTQVLRLRPTDVPPATSSSPPTSSTSTEIHSRYDSSWKKNIRKKEEERLKVELSRRKKEREEARQRALQEFQADRKRVRLLHGNPQSTPSPAPPPQRGTATNTGEIRLRILDAADRRIVVQRNVKPEDTLAVVLMVAGQTPGEVYLRMPPSSKFEGHQLHEPIGQLLGGARSCQLLMGPRLIVADAPLPTPAPMMSVEESSREEETNREETPQLPSAPQGPQNDEDHAGRFPGVGHVLENDEEVPAQQQEQEEQQQEQEQEEEQIERFPGVGHVLENDEEEPAQEQEQEQEQEQVQEEQQQLPDLAHPDFGVGVRVHPMDPGAAPVRREDAREAAGRAAAQRPGPPPPRPSAPVAKKRLDGSEVKTLLLLCRRNAAGWIARTDCPIFIMRQLRGLPSDQAGAIVDDLIKDGRFAPRIVPYLPPWLAQLDLSRYPLITNMLLHLLSQRLVLLTHLNLDASQPMMNVDGLRSVAGLQHLESLSLCGQNRLDASGLSLIVNGCSSLRTLILRHCSLGCDAAFHQLVKDCFRDSSVPSSQLANLDVAGCESLSVDGLIGLRCFPELVFLRLVSCPQLMDLKPGDIPPMGNLRVVELPSGDRVSGEEVEKLMWSD